ncbi:hypothetical protein BJ508DRAFT_90163 [Ascobolus immersus RN42]|uniref:Uncharacterized protein n=1 Tax=Ascobolus immersus RN42 TaxID=1160509 RepID=A0A3N4HPB0_ASCIM|nr:hypothetical protein BJ508DRAFT_90163 [Ascobolus immersus RN42]
MWGKRQKERLDKVLCYLVDHLKDDIFIFALNTRTSPLHRAQNHLLSKIKPLLVLDERLYKKLQGKGSDCVQWLRLHMFERCDTCKARTDTDALKAGLVNYELRRPTMRDYEVTYLDKLANERVKVFVDGLRAQQHAKFLRYLEEEKQTHQKMHDQAVKWRTECYCDIIATAIRNPEFLALFEESTDRTPTILANIILEKEFCRLRDELFISEEQIFILEDVLGEGPRDHLLTLRRHLFSDPPLPPVFSGWPKPPRRMRATFKDTCVTGRCLSPGDPLLVEFKQRLLAVDRAVKTRLEGEMAVVEKRLPRKVSIWQRRCYAAHVLSMHSGFMELLRDPGPAGYISTWVFAAGRIVKEVHEGYSKETKAPELQFGGSKWQPGRIFGEELLWHLFGKRRGLQAPCTICPSIPSIQAMKDLLEHAMQTTLRVDLHFQRPLDTIEYCNISEMRNAAYKVAAKELTIPQILGVENSNPSFASIELRVEKAATALRKVLDSGKRRRLIVVIPLRRPRGRVRIKSTRESFTTNGWVHERVIWDDKAPADVFLEGFIEYLQDTDNAELERRAVLLRRMLLDLKNLRKTTAKYPTLITEEPVDKKAIIKTEENLRKTTTAKSPTLITDGPVEKKEIIKTEENRKDDTDMLDSITVDTGEVKLCDNQLGIATESKDSGDNKHNGGDEPSNKSNDGTSRKRKRPTSLVVNAGPRPRKMLRPAGRGKV